MLGFHRRPASIRTTILFLAIVLPFTVSAQSPAVDFIIHEIDAEYRGAAAHLLEEQAVQPASLAAADFDEDGVPDLVVGYGDGETGLVAVHFGNVRSIYPAAGMKPGSAFLPDARVIAASLRADHIATGDFDADGHFDVVVASNGATALELRRGDGAGLFAPAEFIELGGGLTAMAVGEVNRRDGHPDVVIGIDGSDGPRILVFESPLGALRGAPEIFDAFEVVRSIELGNFDEDLFRDIVARSESYETTITGRDRRLSLGEHQRAEVPEAVVSVGSAQLMTKRQSPAFAQEIEGDIVALLAMRLNRDAFPDSVVITDASPVPMVVKTLSRATFTVDSTADDPDFDTGDGVCDTDDGVGDGPCTLRAAIEQANASAGADAIEFDISGPGPHVIQPAPALPQITESATIDGTTEPDFVDLPVVELDGLLAGTDVHGLEIQSAGNTTVRGLSVYRFDNYGILYSFVGGNIVEGCILGTNAAGDTDLGNGWGGAGSWSCSGNTVGGTVPQARNIASGNNSGISCGEGDTCQGNWLGLDPTGTTALPNYRGAGASGVGCTFGGVTAGAANVVSGNVAATNQGIGLSPGTDALIHGNLIGTDPTGTIAIGNSGEGIEIRFADGVVIGGTSPAMRNIISGNYYGIATESTADDALIQGNYIGTDITGMVDLGNLVGVACAVGDRCIVGGAVAGAGNLVSGNFYGISVGTNDNVVQGNLVGTDATGLGPLPNESHGVSVGGSSNVVGGTNPGEANIIAFNDGHGVRITLGTGHSVLGNSIHSNTGINSQYIPGNGFGIELGYQDVVEANDPGDPDTGPNNLQNYPVLADVTAGGTTVNGSLNSTPSTSFDLHFYANTACDASGHGEGETYLGSDTVTTDAVGDVSFSSAVTVPVPVGAFVTATATDPAGNTSEFSQCFQYAPSADLQTTIVDGVTEVLPGDQLTYTIVASNLGPDAMSDATFQANLGYPMSCSTTCIPAGGATCSPGPILGDVEEQIFLPVGGTASYTAVCDVDFTAVGTLEVSAGIYPPAGAVDPDWNNNESTDTNTILPVDWGDAPDPAYPTLPGSDGARHQIAGGLYLGAAVDADPGGQPTPGADGDDTDGTDDEDGVTFTGIVMTGATASLEVSASAFGLLNAWLDLDGNGSWLDPGEQIFTDEPLGAGINPLSFPVPAAATPGDSFARFRFDSVGGLAPTGYAADGEVEDEPVEIRSSTLDIAKTGQTTSYAAGDDGTYQAGAPWPDPRFTDNGDGTLTDELTGLTWAQDSVNPGPAPCNPGVTRNWFLSLDYVDCLNSNSWLGHTDWRMPNIVELGSLVHYAENEQRPWWSTQGFAATTNYRWWSSTTLPSSLGFAQTLSAFASFSNFGKLAVSGTAVWPVRGGDLGDGAVQLPETGQVRCWDDTYAEVPCAGTGQDGDHRAGAEWPTPRFEVSGDCVTDRLTGLTWSRDANPFGFRSWQHALEDALGLSLCGYNDWRLPTTRELQTLYHFDKRWDIAPPSLTGWWQDQGFTNVSNESAWTSTSHAGSPADVAWIAWSGYSKDTDDSLIVWPVRGGVHGDSADLAVTIADSDDPVMPGDPVVYSIDVSNLGPSTAPEVAVTTALPDGATFVSSSGTGWSCGEVDLVVTCTMASLPVGAAPQVSVEITAPTTPGILTATCFVDSALDDIVGDNNGDTEDTVVIGYDFGDALDPTYPTLLASNGARHLTGGSLHLGATVDSDPDGQPTANADGDDNDGTDDEDGVVFTSIASPGGTADVDVEASEAGLLNAWVDFNADGDWDDAGEQIFTDEALVAGSNSLTFAVPVGAAVAGDTFARFRVDSSGGLLPTGAASDGEVEDHVITIEELDFGDAPDPTYPTLAASNGARHLIDGVTYLGAAVDADPDGQPNVNADGDDNDAQGDDEDGISYITWPVAGQLCTIRVTASTAGIVNAWIDYNADGDWADAGEHVFVDVAVVAGQNNLDYTIPITATTGVDTYARFRFSTSGGLSFEGPAPDGEVEDYKMGIVALDFGDAPDPSYPTLQASDGARHIIEGGLFLGAGVDLEADGQPSAAADGDDLDGNDDEDGVIFTSALGRGLDATLDVTASGAGLLNAWVDFNADGDWADSGEQIFTDQLLAAGVNALSFPVPAGATLGTTFSRFRLDSTGGLSPSGYATNGEVEDHAVEIVEGPDLQIGIIASAAYVPSGDPLGYTITVTNNGPLSATAVTVTDTLPAGLIFVSSTPGTPDCSFSGGTLTCDLGTMAPTDTAQITIDAVLDHPVWGTLSNTAAVSASESDPIMANNSATVDTLIALFVDGFETGDTTRWSLTSP